MTLKNPKGDTRRMLMNIGRNNLTSRLRINQQHIKTTRPLEKLDHQKLGPFLIVKQISVMAFKLKLLGFMWIHHMFHVSLLEPYHTSTISRKIHDSPPSIEINGEQEYEWTTFWIQRSLTVNSNIWFISRGMMWMNTLGNHSKTYQTPWRRFISFINEIWTSPIH